MRAADIDNLNSGLRPKLSRLISAKDQSIVARYLEKYAIPLLRCIRQNVQRGMTIILVLVSRELVHFCEDMCQK